ncbi:MAG: hypothetical protein ABIQ70_13530, partial [Dokdonella sp.]
QGTCASALQLSAALCTSAALAAGGLLFSLLQASWPMRAFASVLLLALVISAIASIGAQRAYPAKEQ